MKNQEVRSKNQGVYCVEQADTGKRLDIFLAEKMHITRSAVQKMITRGQVIVNGKRPSKTGYKVVSSDMIGVSEPDSRFKIQDSRFKFQVIAQTPEYLVVDKPAGLIVHEAPSKEQVTLVDLLLEKYPELKGIGDLPTGRQATQMRPGIVHRLDKDASGVMVIAKTQESFDSLKRQFKLRRVGKEYLILVYGHVEPAEGTIDLPIARSASHSTKFVGTTAGGRQAVTNYKVEQYLNEYSLVRVTPETGRTHQIRVHFFSRGYPLVGDTVYTSKKIKTSLQTRLMLHACSLEFRDLSDAVQAYDCPPGKDFQEILERLQNPRDANGRLTKKLKPIL